MNTLCIYCTYIPKFIKFSGHEDKIKLLEVLVPTYSAEHLLLARGCVSVVHTYISKKTLFIAS